MFIDDDLGEDGGSELEEEIADTSYSSNTQAINGSAHPETESTPPTQNTPPAQPHITTPTQVIITNE